MALEQPRLRQAARRHLKACARDDPRDGSLLLPALNQAGRAEPQTFTSFAAKVGMSRVGLAHALSKDGNPKFKNLMRILRDLDIHIQIAP